MRLHKGLVTYPLESAKVSSGRAPAEGGANKISCTAATNGFRYAALLLPKTAQEWARIFKIYICRTQNVAWRARMPKW
jgi:hypothetical protein